MPEIPTSGSPVTFQRERAQDCFAEVKPLLEAHWEETVGEELPLDPDWEAYRACEDIGLIRAYGLRVENELQGYALYFVRPSLHSRALLLASNDLLYVTPALRGRYAIAFIEWCEAQLRAEGVEMVSQHVTVHRDFGVVLKHLGYHQAGTFWMRRLSC